MKILTGLILIVQMTAAQAAVDVCRTEPTGSLASSKILTWVQSHPNLRLTGYDQNVYPRSSLNSLVCCISFDVAKEDWPFDCEHNRMVCVDLKIGQVIQDDIQYNPWCDY